MSYTYTSADIGYFWPPLPHILGQAHESVTDWIVTGLTPTRT